VKNRGENLELVLCRVNLISVACIALIIAACGPPPRSVLPGAAPAHSTPLGNQRRAGYEAEAIPAAPTVAWDVDAGTGMRGSLVLVDSAVLTATTNRQLLAFHTSTGVRYWDQRFGAAVQSTLLYDRGKLYVGTTQYDGDLVARDITRGRQLWKTRVGPIRFTPLLHQQMLYVGTDDGVVAAVRTESGDRRWRVGLRSSIAQSLIDAGDHLVAFTANDSVFALRKQDGALLARGRIGATPSALPALSGNTVIVPTQSGLVFGVDATSLATIWQVQADGPVHTPPAVTADGDIYIASRNGTLYRIRGSGQLEKLRDLGHALSPSLTLTRNHLLLGSYDGTLLAVNLDGTIAWQHSFDDSIVAPVAVADGAVYVPLLRGRIVKLQ
jgi:outer membrane protein assembly factor BamB